MAGFWLFFSDFELLESSPFFLWPVFFILEAILGLATTFVVKVLHAIAVPSVLGLFCVIWRCLLADLELFQAVLCVDNSNFALLHAYSIYFEVVLADLCKTVVKISILVHAKSRFF